MYFNVTYNGISIVNFYHTTANIFTIKYFRIIYNTACCIQENSSL